MLSLCEQETIITFDEEGENASIYTQCKRIADRLAKAGFQMENKGSGWEVEIDKGFLAIRPSRKSFRLAREPKKLKPKSGQKKSEPEQLKKAREKTSM